MKYLVSLLVGIVGAFGIFSSVTPAVECPLLSCAAAPALTRPATVHAHRSPSGVPIAALPEPIRLALFGLGMLGMARVARTLVGN